MSLSEPTPPLRLVVAAVPFLRRGEIVAVLGVELIGVGCVSAVAGGSLGDHLPPVLLERPPEENQLPSRGESDSRQGESQGGAVAADEGGVPVRVEAVEAFFFWLVFSF